MGNTAPDWIVYLGIASGMALLLYGAFYDKLWGLNHGSPQVTDEKKVEITNHPVTSHSQSGGLTGNTNETNCHDRN